MEKGKRYRRKEEMEKEGKKEETGRKKRGLEKDREKRRE